MKLIIVISLLLAAVRGQNILAWQQRFLDLTNAKRQQHGVQPLCLNVKLNDVAHQYSLVLMQSNTFSHIGPDGSNPADRVTRSGYNWTHCGENLASPDTPEGAFQRLFDSEGHRANILNRNYNMMGVGGTTLSDPHEGVWVQMFGGSTSETCMGSTTANPPPASPPPANPPPASPPPASPPPASPPPASPPPAMEGSTAPNTNSADNQEALCSRVNGELVCNGPTGARIQEIFQEGSRFFNLTHSDSPLQSLLSN